MSGERPEVRLCDHPRATRQIDLARGWAGIATLAAVWLLSLRAGVPVLEAGLRALLAAVAAYVAVWALAVLVWRQLAVAEVRAAHAAAEERRREVLEQVERRAAEARERRASKAG